MTSQPEGVHSNTGELSNSGGRRGRISALASTQLPAGSPLFRWELGGSRQATGSAQEKGLRTPPSGGPPGRGPARRLDTEVHLPAQSYQLTFFVPAFKH